MHSPRFSSTIRIALLSTTLLAAARAGAQLPPLRGESPTRGPEIPVTAVAGDPEATSVVTDAANLAYLKAWHFTALYTQLDDQGLRGPSGGGLYLGAPLPFLHFLAAGASIEYLHPPAPFPYRDGAKLALALALHPTQVLSFGLTYAHVFTGNTPGVAGAGIDTLDVSALGRFGRFFSLALVVHDLPSPGFLGLGLQRVYQAEAAVRFLGTDRLELGLSFKVGERRADFVPAARLQLIPFDGLAVRAGVEFVTDLYGDLRYMRDVRATVGLELNLARFGVGGYVHFGGGDAQAANLNGWSLTARISGDRWPALFRFLRLERVDVGKGDDRHLAALTTRLRRLERDRRCEGIIAVMGDAESPGRSWASMEELRDAFTRLRTAGKHVFAYATELDTKTYYAAAAAERLYLDPAGGLDLVGISTTGLYFKELGENLGVRADFVKIGEYKSAPEQYTRSGPSDEARRVRGAILDDDYARLVAAIARDRKLDEDRVRATIDAGPFSAGEARGRGLVDELKHGDEVEAAIGAALGRRVNVVPPDEHPFRPRAWELPAIAAIFVEGDLVDGKSRTIPLVDMKLVGHETLIRALETAREDYRVKAIVLRIDSPGGSALAADLVAREVVRTRRVKPVICSFGDMAASGGYFIAAGCDAIYADPSTLTGSIGIFTGKFDVSGLAATLGVGATLTSRGAHADIEGMWRPYSDEERRTILGRLHYYYERFVDAVAAGRKLTAARVDELGRGHVWTGAQAAEHKLVDHLGGFTDAVAEAKRRVGLKEADEVELLPFPAEETSLLGQLAQLLGLGGDDEAAVLSALAPIAGLLKHLPPSLLVAPSIPQARLDYAIAVP